MRALLLGALLVGCSGGEGGGDDSDLRFCVDEVNRYRAMVGVAPVARAADLEAYAAEGARIDQEATEAHKHFRDTSGGGIAFAENECPGWLGWNLSTGDSVRQIMTDCFALMWSEGPGGGHYENMKGPYTALGCGVYIDGDQVTVVQDFR